MTHKKNPAIVALIPARSGSMRVKDKNIRPLAGHPLMAYAITAARESGIFARIIVSTDSRRYADIAEHYGAEVPFLRPAEFAGGLSPDIEWVEYTLRRLKDAGDNYDCFSILRPTSPFRTAETVKRAWREFLSEDGVDSLRAVEKARQHPGKMWLVYGKRMKPFLSRGSGQKPWHDNQYQSLPQVYIQNASLEIAWTRIVFEKRSISGDAIMPFFTLGHEGFDINDAYDWKLAEEIVRTERNVLPFLTKAVYE